MNKKDPRNPFSSQITARPNEEQLAQLNENHALLIKGLEDEPSISGTMIFMNLANYKIAGLTPKIKEVSKPEDLELIENLKLQINGDGSEENPGLLVLLNRSQDDKAELETEVAELKGKLTNQKNDFSPAENKIELKPGEEIVNFGEELPIFLDEIIDYFRTKRNKEMTRFQVLTKLFWTELKEGWNGFFPLRYTDQDIKAKIKEHLKQDGQ